MVETVFLFPGQGSQFPGMAKDLYESSEAVKDLFHRASEAVGRDMVSLLFEGSEEDLKATENAQAAIVLASLAAREALAENGIESQGTAGHSLGEYSALVDAGVLGAESALKAVEARGRHMAAAAAEVERSKGATGMAAVIGIGPQAVREALKDTADVWSANENGPNQVVIAGTKSAMAQAEDALKAAGARRVIPLKVSGPFHTPLMTNAAEALKTTLDDLDFSQPIKTIWSNVTAAPVRTAAEAKDLLVRQITGSVRWVDLSQAVAEERPGAMYEVGPGKVLSGLWAKSGLDGTCSPAGTAGDLENIKTKA